MVDLSVTLKLNETGNCLTCINVQLRNMWLKIIFVLNFIVLRSISCQPVKDSIRDTRQTNFEECCPCSGDDGTDFRDEDMSPSSSMGSFTQGPDCPCRLSGTDSQGSSSIFRPFLFRASHPSEREQQSKQGIKPLLQPEVGLASSVLETIQKATDEEYKDALARDAARNVLEIESGLGPGNSRNSVTIVLNTSDDMYDGDDTMPEASHAHETRCIHSPLGRPNLVNDIAPRMNKQNLLLKRKPAGYTFKSLFDMDNSASNIKQSYAANNNNLSTKLRINPSLLNVLPSDEEISSNPMSRAKSYELRTIHEYCNDLKNNEVNSPKLRLAALRNRVRELVEQRNTKRLNNIPATLRHNNLDIFNTEGSHPVGKLSTLTTNSPLDALFDRQSPVLKNILKLKDVELIPPVKTISQGITEEKSKLSDLNFAGSENDVTLSHLNKSEEIEEYDKNDVGKSEEYVSKDQTASKDEPITSVQKNNSDEMSTNTDKDIEFKDSRETSDIPKLLNACLKLATDSQDVNESDEAAIVNDSTEYDSKEVDDESEMEGPVAETSDILEEQLSQEDSFDSSTVQQNSPESNDDHVSSLEQKNDGLTIFKNDILRKLENIKKSIKSKLQDTNTEKITKPIVSQPVYEKATKIDSDQDIDSLDSNSEDNLNIVTTPQSAKENDVTMQELQNLSDSLLKQEDSLKANNILSSTEGDTKFDDNGENQEFQHSINTADDNRSVSSEFDATDTEENENQVSSEDDDDRVFNESSTPDKQEDNSENSKRIFDVISNENNESDIDNKLPKESASNDMSFEASNSKYNAISSPLNDNGPTLQDTFNLFKTPLQIPTLEEIRQGITDIIDAGQQESEDFEQTRFDPLNQSSNRNSVLSNLPTFNNLGKPLTDRYIRPFQISRNNIEGYKSVFDSVSSKPLIMQPFYPSTTRNFLGPSVPKSGINKILKSSPDTSGIPSLDDIRSFFETQNHMKPPKTQLSRTNLIGNPILKPQKTNTLADDLKYRFDNSLKPDFKQAKQVNQLLNKPRLETNDILESMSRKHEDMKEKLQALHLDFSDRVASIYKKINDQRKLQPGNPTFREQTNSLSLPKTAYKKEKNDQKYPNRLVNKEDNFPFQSHLLHDQMSMKKKITPNLNSSPLKIPLGNNNLYTMKASRVPLTEKDTKPVKNIPNLSEQRKYDMNNKKNLRPISKVRISFTTTTNKPILASSKVQKTPDLIRAPSRLSGTEGSAVFNSNLKDITDSIRSRLRPGDSSHAPSELIETEKLSDVLTNLKIDKHPRIDNEADSKIKSINLENTNNSIPKKKESKFISNLREALKARLENINNNAIPTTPKTKYPLEPNLKELDAIVSPSGVKTSVHSNPLIENTSYKCTMVCSKDQ